MPTAHHGNLVDFIDDLKRVNPKSILDIGIGFGRNGHLCREYLDVMRGNVWKSDWKVRIDGIEIFEKYIMPHQSFIYDNIFIMNCIDFYYKKWNYDLIIMGDVLEHIEKNRAKLLLDEIIANNKYFILSVPMGDKWLKQGSMYGNDNEAHISVWDKIDFKGYDIQCYKEYMCNNKPIAYYLFKGKIK